jgi:hypothetical protein
MDAERTALLIMDVQPEIVERLGDSGLIERLWPDPVHRSTCCESWWLVGSCRVGLPPASDGAGA